MGHRHGSHTNLNLATKSLHTWMGRTAEDLCNQTSRPNPQQPTTMSSAHECFAILFQGANVFDVSARVPTKGPHQPTYTIGVQKYLGKC
jgi:hypothetical protein